MNTLPAANLFPLHLNMTALKNNMIVFLADDDADDRLLFEEALREIYSDVKLTTAKNGEQLMGILDKTTPPPPHLIFLDLNMPLLNGFECLEQIRKNNKYKNIPVVICSTSSQKEAIDQVYKKGADYYLCKPDSFQQLKKLLHTVCSIDHLKQTSRRSREEFFISC